MSADKAKMLALLEQASDSLDKAIKLIQQKSIMIMKAKQERNRALNNYLMLSCALDQVNHAKENTERRDRE